MKTIYEFLESPLIRCRTMRIENGVLAINHKGRLLLWISRSPRCTFSEKKSLLPSSLSWIAWSFRVCSDANTTAGVVLMDRQKPGINRVTWLLIPVIHGSDPWIYMEIRGYLWSICYIWTTLMRAAAATHQCAVALHKLVELINLTPSLNKNTLWWIWIRIYWNKIISLAFSPNITLTLLLHYIYIHRMDYVTFLVLNKLTNLLTGQKANVYGISVTNTYHTHLWVSKILTVVGICVFQKKIWCRYIK